MTKSSDPLDQKWRNPGTASRRGSVAVESVVPYSQARSGDRQIAKGKYCRSDAVADGDHSTDWCCFPDREGIRAVGILRRNSPDRLRGLLLYRVDAARRAAHRGESDGVGRWYEDDSLV